MLATVISEKSLPRLPGATTPTPTPTRSNTFQNVSSSANQRLKGLLSGRSPTFDKALPTPMRTSTLSPSPSQTTLLSGPTSPVPRSNAQFDHKNVGETTNGTPSPPSKAIGGFKQIDDIVTSEPEPIPESLTTDGNTKTTDSEVGMQSSLSLPLHDSPACSTPELLPEDTESLAQPPPPPLDNDSREKALHDLVPDPQGVEKLG